MSYILILFIVLVGGGWLVGKLTNIALFPKNKTTSEPYEFNYSNDISTVQKKMTFQDVISNIEIKQQEDEFNETSFIYFDNIVREDSNYLPMFYKKIVESEDIVSSEHLGISFSLFEGIIYLDVYSGINGFNLAKGDSVIFLFENKQKIEVVFKSSSSKDFIKANNYIINNDDLDIFINQKLDKWKLISSRRNLFVTGNNTMFFERYNIDKDTAQLLIQSLAKKIKNIRDFGVLTKEEFDREKNKILGE